MTSHIFAILTQLTRHLLLGVLLYSWLNTLSWAEPDILNSAERSWLQQNQSRLTLAIETGYAPFMFIDANNQPAGLAHDYMKLIEQKLGVQFKQQRYTSLNEIFSKVRSGEVHIVNAVTSTPERAKFLAMTNAFINVPNVIIMRQDAPHISEQQLSGLKVSLIKSYAVTEYINKHYHQLRPIFVEDDLSALLNVSFGHCDAAVLDLATASYLISAKGISNLHVVGTVSYDVRLSIGATLNEPILHTILQKGLNAISDAEQKEIKNRWISVASDPDIFHNRQFWIIFSSTLTIALLLIGSILLWNRTLHRQIVLRKHAEAELTRYKDHLEELIDTRTNDLVLARNAAEAANKAKSAFLASISHELRTPLNAILGFSSLMRQEPQLTPSQSQNLDIINRSGAHLLTLINDVLEMSKIEAGKLQLENSPFDLGNMVRDIIDIMTIRAKEKGLQLLLDQSSHFPRYIYGDEARLRQILINLLGNAVKFTQQGGVTLRLGTKENSIAHLIIEVEDTGPGIAAADQVSLFQPFVQLGKQAGDNKGTGLGLAITQQFVQLMGGKIQLESCLGKGSIFRVDLPLKEVKQHEIIAAEPSRSEVIGLAPNQTTYRILIIEDQLENQLLLSTLMQRIGMEVKVANNGEQGIQLFSNWQPQLIWMDRRMPGLDGIETTRRIRALPHGKEVRIVAVTASAFMEQRAELLAAGMDDFVRKPYRFSEIYDCLSRQLGVKYRYAEETPSKTELPTLTSDMLAILPAELRQQLHDALENLDSEQVNALVQQIAAYDHTLQQTLQQLIDNFDYPAILQVLEQGTQKQHQKYRKQC